MSRGSGRDNHSILSELEWDEGLSMPVANAENKALEDEVEIFQIMDVILPGLETPTDLPIIVIRSLPR